MNRSKIISAAAISIFVLIVAIAGSFVIPWLYVSYVNKWKYTADFDQYKSDFCVVKEYAEKAAEFEGDRFFVSTTDNGKALFDPKEKVYLDIPDNVEKSLEAIDNFAFPDKDSNLYYIQIYGKKVFFCIENGRYALVYSPDGKPAWVKSPDEQGSVDVKKADEDWYHVVLVNQ